MWALPAGSARGGAVTGRRVALVGAGPGDPDLMTLRAEAVLAAAATVVCDVAVESLARRFAPLAEVVVVSDGRPAVPVLLAAASKPDRALVRLYVGDPWLHAAHGEELAALHQAGIASEPVAGVATEVAVPARAGIAVHVRQLAVVCTIATADAAPPSVDPAHTLVLSGDDGPATARRLAERGGQAVPSAILPLGDEAQEVRGALGEINAGGRPSLVVVGAVVGAGPATAVSAGKRPSARSGGRR